MFWRCTIMILIILAMAACAAPPSNIPPGINQPEENPPASSTQPAENYPTPYIEPWLTETPPQVITPVVEPKIIDPNKDVWIAYIGYDSNVWVLNRGTGVSEQITFDAAPYRMGSSAETILEYWRPRWSSDGRFLAFQQDTGRPQAQGYNYSHQLLVMDLEMGEFSTVVYHPVLGFGWQPGTHRLAYAPPVAETYWEGRGGPNMEAARGIWEYDADTGEQYELVPPERGYTLVMPKWSHDGRYISFDEVLYMEGRGYFAYYNLLESKYVSWDEVIGGYDWSADSKSLAYDKLAYIAERNERIWLRELDGSERVVSPEYIDGYAYNPAFSPDGKYLAYLADLDGMDGMGVTLIISGADGAEPREIGVFEQIYHLTWSPNGEKLYFFAGQYQEEKVYEVGPRDGSVQVLAEGKDSDVVVK
jgi:Tol biopolymer transport system component